jgi:hypothetical protein
MMDGVDARGKDIVLSKSAATVGGGGFETFGGLE